MIKKRIFIILLHLTFWLLSYLYITSGNLSWNGFGKEEGLLKKAYLYGMFFNALLFYIQVFWLVPKYYVKNKKAMFWGFSIVLFFLITYVETYLDVALAVKYRVYSFEPIAAGIIWFYHNSIFHFIYFIVGFYYRFQQEYIKSERVKQELLIENHNAELKYLKAQLNPHFLFNGINSIYHLIGKNNANAKNTLLKFSNLLRYQLYESNTNKIELYKEINYIEEYISIERIRKGEDIVLNLNIDIEKEHNLIMPLLLIPFIENAFKHISNHNEAKNNIISISIVERNNLLKLIVNNSKDFFHHQAKSGGIGLKNVRKRLNLLYKDKYDLNIKSTEDTHEVELIIHLN
ncbi:sensor histidine kinase [uncultured Tenacibaculum sp.]|uniref:sensor histidine kinase n=1 Tax=uncultured Tenacibaculum sp. TaxID=174713 RepID=UPI002632E5A4|nr:histidine kinase [uncultured Tenacibaculum sp.]